MSFWDDSAGYDLRDPKHPMNANAGVGLAGPSDRVSTLPRTTGRSAPTASRIRVLTAIAEHYRELIDPMNGPGGAPGSGEWVALMPDTYTPTVREFERLLRVMRDDRHAPLVELATGKVSVRQLAWHLREWHLNAQPVIRWKPVKASHKTRKRVKLVGADGQVVKRPERGWLRHPQANPRLAEAAIAWMAEAWSAGFEPFLPVELQDKAA